MKMRKLVALIAAAAMALSLAACGGSAAPAASSEAAAPAESSEAAAPAETFTLKISTEQAATEPFGKMIDMLAKKIEEKTNGAIKCEIYYSAELAKATDACEQIQQGANVMTFATMDFYGSYVPDLGILDGPFFFYTPEEFFTLQESDWWAEQMEKLKEMNIGNGGALYFGARSLNHKVKDGTAPADFKGQLMRSATTEMRYAMSEAITGNVTAVAWSEIYQALSTGVADMCEAPLGSIQSTKIYEVCPYITLTEHIQAWQAIWYAQSWYDSLPEDVQKGFDEACMEMEKESIAITQEADQQIRKELEEAGVTFYERSSAEEWAEATKSAYDAVEWTPGTYERCMEILGH